MNRIRIKGQTFYRYVDILGREPQAAVRVPVQLEKLNDGDEYNGLPKFIWLEYFDEDTLRSQGFDYHGDFSDTQCKAICEILKREAEHGTQKAARMSSNTFGDGTLKPLNSSFVSDPELKDGKVDIDWYTDVQTKSISNNSAWLTAPVAYPLGRLLWKTVGGTSNNPYYSEGERNAMDAVVQGKSYKDLFSPDLLYEKGCDCDCIEE